MQVFQLQIRENTRAYVRELAGWDRGKAADAHLAAVRLIERAENDPVLAENLLAAEPEDLDQLINGNPTKTPVKPDPDQET